MPSLSQLDQAVREFIGENPDDVVTVVVDASFGHRIDPSELPAFEEAEAAGEVISPPAGAIGRGDAFLLRIAEKTGATVLSNDSFQEFHGEHTWLFEKGRLVGGKPVPGVGWIFMDRSPVRGAKSREVTKEAKRKKRESESTAPKAAPPEQKPKTRSKSVDRAIARATEEVVGPKPGSKSRRRRTASPPAEPVNEPLAFITFIAAHPLGSDVVGTVLEYSSHGAFVEADGARCYIPLSAMSSPPPRRAREVVTKGEPCTFVVQAFDPQRRGIELALPGFAKVAGEPTAETVEAEISGEKDRSIDGEKAGGRRRSTRKPAPVGASAPGTADGGGGAPAGEEVAGVGATGARAGSGESGGSGAPGAPAAPPAKRATRARKAVKQSAASDGAPATPAKRAAARKAAPAESVAPGGGAPAEATGPEDAVPAKKAAAATKTPAAKKAASGEKAVAKKAASGEKAAAKKAPATKKAPAAKKAAGAKKAPAATKAAPAKKAAGSKKAATPAEGAPSGTKKAAASAQKSAAAKSGASAKKVAAAAEDAPATGKTSARKTVAKKASPRGGSPAPAA